MTYECITAYATDDHADLLTTPVALTEADWWASLFVMDDDDIAWEEFPS